MPKHRRASAARNPTGVAERLPETLTSRHGHASSTLRRDGRKAGSMNSASGPSRLITRCRMLRAIVSGVLTLLLANAAAAAAQGTAPLAPTAAQRDFAGR